MEVEGRRAARILVTTYNLNNLPEKKEAAINQEREEDTFLRSCR